MTTLRIEGLELQPLTAAHAEMVYAALQDARIYTFIPQDPPDSLDALKRRYEALQVGASPDGAERWLNWVVFVLDDPVPVGTVQATVRPGETALIAYTIFPDYWKCGYGRRATRVVIDHVFSAFDIRSVTARIDTRNQRSIRLVEALGLVRTGVFKDADFFKGASSDEYEYAMSRELWVRSLQSASPCRRPE